MNRGYIPYYIAIGASVAVIGLFIYLTYIVYEGTKGTPYQLLTYIMMTPVFVSIVLLLLILAIGKEGFTREIQQFTASFK